MSRKTQHHVFFRSCSDKESGSLSFAAWLQDAIHLVGSEIESLEK